LFKKYQCLSIFLCAAVMLAAGCSSEGTSEVEPWNGILINDGKPVRLILDLNGLMPTTNTEATEQSPVVFNSIRDIAADFCDNG